MDVCNLDAIEMSHEHELGSFARNGARANLADLLVLGEKYQIKTNWQATNPEKNVAAVALEKKASVAQVPTITESSSEAQGSA